MRREGRDGFWSSLKRNLSSKEEVPELINENQAKQYLKEIKSYEETSSKKKEKKKGNTRKTFGSF